ncbi:MAG: electron transport complex protein RnfB [Candidatus Azotimanducaceae bacterium]|jgi:electron transport complex protein RnfB
MLELISGLTIMTLIGFGIALLLQLTARRFPDKTDEVVREINNLLPQTQCAQCEYPGCKPYAEAISKGEAINHCAPGGEELIKSLADLLGREYIPLDPEFGETKAPAIAVIREDECIGCTFCILACPVDAIIGAPQQMHSILERDCTGCELCLEPCPVDCIDMVAIETTIIDAPVRKIKSITPIEPVACIRCGECEIQCPKDLAPQELYWQRSNDAAMSRLDLDACIECRICDRVCPSHIPLTQTFIESKNRINLEKDKKIAAIKAENQYQAHEDRLALTKKTVKTRANRSDRANILALIKTSSTPQEKKIEGSTK